MIADMRIALLVYVAILGVCLAIQPWLVSVGHPQAVWLWCSMAKLC